MEKLNNNMFYYSRCQNIILHGRHFLLSQYSLYFQYQRARPDVEPWAEGTALAFLGRCCQTKRYQTQMHRRGCGPRSFAAVITNHSSHRQSHSINKGWIIGLDSSDFRQLDNFGWQQGYGAFSVSVSQLPETIQYIQNQVEHHRTRTFQQEYVAFLKRHELSFDDKYLWDRP